MDTATATTTVYVDEMGGLLRVKRNGTGLYDGGADGVAHLTAEQVTANLTDPDMGFVSACEGHESLHSAHMGESVQCNGMCAWKR